MKSPKIGRRSAGLAIAVVFAGVATLALVTYVHGLEGRAYAGVQTVQVYVAKQPIPAGTSADAAIQRAAIGTSEAPRKLVASDAITSLSQIQGRVAAVTIEPGEEILASRFVSPGEAATAQLSIPDGMQAMSVEIDVPHGVGGFVEPGARVSVLAHLSNTHASSSSVSGARVQFVLQDVPVLAVGQRTLTTPAGQSSGQQQQQQQTNSAERVTLTLAVTPAQAEKLGYAIFEGDVYFTLTGPNARPVTTSGRTASNEFR